MWIVGVILAMFAAVAAFPVFDFQVLPSSVMNISCIFNETSVLKTEFWRRTDSQFKSVVEVIHNTCVVNNVFNASAVKCECSDNRVTCNIPIVEISEGDAQWMCDIVIHNIRVPSKEVSVTEHGAKIIAAAQEQKSSERTTLLSTSEKVKTLAVNSKENALTIRTPTDVHSTETTHLMTDTDMNTKTLNTTANGVNSNVIIFSTAGPFILLGIVLIVYLHRRKQRFCPKRSPASAGRTVCVESGSGPVGFTYPINCVELSGEVNNTNTAHNSRSPSGRTKTMQCQCHYDDDAVYSFAKDTEVRIPGATSGFRAHTHSKELSSDSRGDAIYPTVSSSALLYAKGTNGDQIYNKHDSNDKRYITVKDDESQKGLCDIDDPLYSSVGQDDPRPSTVKKKIKTYDSFNRVVHSTVKKYGKSSETDFTGPSSRLGENGISQYTTVGTEDEDDLLYSTVQRDGTKDDTLIAEGYVCDSVERNGPLDLSDRNDFPIYSVVHKKKI